MTQKIEEDLPTYQAGLFACCGYLAELAGAQNLADRFGELIKIGGEKDRKETIETIISCARQEGLQTIIQRVEPGQLAALVPCSPLSRNSVMDAT